MKEYKTPEADQILNAFADQPDPFNFVPQPAEDHQPTHNPHFIEEVGGVTIKGKVVSQSDFDHPQALMDMAFPGNGQGSSGSQEGSQDASQEGTQDGSCPGSQD